MNSTMARDIEYPILLKRGSPWTRIPDFLLRITNVLTRQRSESVNSIYPTFLAHLKLDLGSFDTTGLYTQFSLVFVLGDMS